MPNDKDLQPLVDATWQAMDAQATAKARVRIKGEVVATGEGRSGRYRNAWLRVAAGDTLVHVTASRQSPLGTTPTGSEVDLALDLTGMVDLSCGVYFGQRARLLN